MDLELTLITLPLDIVYHLMSGLSVLDLVVMMYVCKFTKKVSVKILETDRESLQYVMLSDMAAKLGYLSLIQWLWNLEYKFRPSTCAAAAQGGNLKVLEWLNINGCPWDYTTSEMAAKYGHFDLL